MFICWFTHFSFSFHRLITKIKCILYIYSLHFESIFVLRLFILLRLCNRYVEEWQNHNNALLHLYMSGVCNQCAINRIVRKFRQLYVGLLSLQILPHWVPPSSEYILSVSKTIQMHLNEFVIAHKLLLLSPQPSVHHRPVGTVLSAFAFFNAAADYFENNYYYILIVYLLYYTLKIFIWNISKRMYKYDTNTWA